MTMQVKLRDKVWDGSLNIRITLNPKESNEQTTTHRYYLTIPRDSYMQIHLARILSYFKPYLLVPEWSQDLSQWWLECDDDVPVKWNYPIGLSHDLIVSDVSDVWDLKLNYRDYPKQFVILVEDNKNNNSLDFLQDYWINQVKQACYILNGSAKIVMSLSKEDSVKMWQGVVNHNLPSYSSIATKFIPLETNKIRNIPIRLYLPMLASNNVLQPVINPLDSRTIGDMLQELIPDLFMVNDDVYRLAYPVIQGITVPKDAPLVDIYKLFAYVDGFLHVTILIN